MSPPDNAPYGQWTCDVCGHMVDTPMHELGCPLGRPPENAKGDRMEACEVLMDDGTWQPGGQVTDRDGARALVAFQELLWWAEADEWRAADA